MSNKLSSKRFALKALVAAATAVTGLAAVSQAQATATIIINNINAAGIGFNDPAPALPVGGNTGTTVGEQRLIAFTHAANIWGRTLTSNVPIIVNAQFTPLTCTAAQGVLGSAGATQVFADFANSQKPNTWYSFALANKLAGADLGAVAASPQINSNFNSNLGTPGCLETSRWYYGLDSNEPAGAIDFVAVLQHEMAHGLGFQTFTSGSTGAFFSGRPSIWDHFLFDATNNVNWADATTAQRASSAISVDKLVWTGASVTAGVPQALRIGLPGVAYTGRAAGPLTGSTISAGEASFGPVLTPAGVTSQVMPITTIGCDPLSSNDARAVNGNIALIDRGTCGFTVKVKNAQNAGAVGVLIADNMPGAVAGLGGSDPTVTIPAVRLTLADGNALKAQLAKRSRTGSGVFARIGLFGSQIAGADSLGRALMFAPNPFQQGSSVSHFDTSAAPNQLMEPSISGDLTQSATVNPLPIPGLVLRSDLTFSLFQDIGWSFTPIVRTAVKR
jgi:hypothetical protein